MSPKQKRVLETMKHLHEQNGEVAWYYRHIATECGMEEAETRRVVRALKRNGYVAHVVGLIDEYDGMLKGSGHWITPKGLSAL